MRIQTSKPQSAPLQVSRRRFIQTSAAAGTVLSIASVAPRAFALSDPQSLISVSATQLAKMIRAREVTATEAVKAYLTRIDAVNPKINAVVAFCRERALAEAAEC